MLCKIFMLLGETTDLLELTIGKGRNSGLQPRALRHSLLKNPERNAKLNRGRTLPNNESGVGKKRTISEDHLTFTL